MLYPLIPVSIANIIIRKVLSPNTSLEFVTIQKFLKKEMKCAKGKDNYNIVNKGANLHSLIFKIL